MLHIGFVVTHGHEGVFLKCMRGMLNRLDGERFRITVACSRQAGEQILRLGVANPAVDYLALPSDLEAAAGLVRQADFDILHYWEVGTDVLNYFLPFYGLAPVQCATWGWPVTSGIPQVDYFLSCELLEGEHSQRLYSERLVQFKRLPTYYYRPPVPAEMQPRSRFGLGAHDHLYLCSQNLRKVHPDFDRLALEILRADPKGRVLFIQDAQPGVTELLRQRLQNTLEETSGRVQFLPRLPEADYLNLLGVVDVALDTVHYCGGANTCYDAFAMGTPVVTLPMHYQRGRYTAAAYRQMGLPDLIAYSARDYVNLALRLACEPDFRRHYSDEIRSRCEALFEDQGAVDELSQFFEEAYA